MYGAQDSTDGPLNIEANFPSDTENFADFIDAANDEEQDTEDPPILPNINNGEELTSLTNEAAMGTGIEGALRYEDDIQGAHWSRNEDGIEGALRNEDGIASVPPPTLPAIDHQLYDTGGDKHKPPKFRSIAHPFFKIGQLRSGPFVIIYASSSGSWIGLSILVMLLFVTWLLPVLVIQSGTNTATRIMVGMTSKLIWEWLF